MSACIPRRSHEARHAGTRLRVHGVLVGGVNGAIMSKVLGRKRRLELAFSRAERARRKREFDIEQRKLAAWMKEIEGKYNLQDTKQYHKLLNAMHSPTRTIDHRPPPRRKQVWNSPRYGAVLHHIPEK